MSNNLAMKFYQFVTEYLSHIGSNKFIHLQLLLIIVFSPIGPCLEQRRITNNLFCYHLILQNTTKKGAHPKENPSQYLHLFQISQVMDINPHHIFSQELLQDRCQTNYRTNYTHDHLWLILLDWFQLNMSTFYTHTII